MPRKRSLIDVTDEERSGLQQLRRRGAAGTRKLPRARILLKADQGLSDEAIARALDIGRTTVERTRQRFVEEHLGALHERPRPGGRRKLTATQAAHLIAVACTPAPEGQARWTLKLLADKVVEVGFVDAMAREPVRSVLKNTPSSRGSTNGGVCRR
jgi:putative transposase